MKIFLGLDIGTGGCKALLMNEEGVVLANVMNEYAIRNPQPLWSEQDPSDWWEAVIRSLQNVCKTASIHPADISAIGITGQMHGLVLLDQNNEVIRPCILWNDQRTVAQCRDINELLGESRVLNLTGNQVLPGFTAPKILWVREQERDQYVRIRKILLPKDYIRYCFTRTFFTDVSDASGTSLFDVSKRTWSNEMLDALSIPHDWLPEIAESPSVVSGVDHIAARLTGLKEGTPIVAGAGDQAAQAIGSGIIVNGRVSVTIGTSGVVFASMEKYHVDRKGRMHAFCHAAPNLWHVMGVMLSAGASFRWFRDSLCHDEVRRAKDLSIDPYDLLTELASGIPIGSDNLLFLPYLSGERTPHADPYSRGVFFGLTQQHTKAHLTRAVMEGITFGLRDSLELLKENRIKIERIRMSGGGAKSKFWQQMLADIFHSEIEIPLVSEGAAYGAAILAAVGVGQFSTTQHACEQVIRISSITTTSSDARTYDAHYERYRALYPALKDQFGKLASTP